MSEEFIYETAIETTIHKTASNGWTYEDIDLEYSFDVGKKKWAIPLEPTRAREEYEIDLSTIVDLEINTENNPLILIDNITDKEEWQYDNFEFGLPHFGNCEGLLPFARKVASQTMGLELVAVKPMSSPSVNLMYLDYQYTPSTSRYIKIESSDTPLIIAKHNPIIKPVKKWKQFLKKVIKKAKSIF